MIKTNKLTLAAILLSSLASASFASTSTDLSTTAANSVHIGLDLGYAGIQSPRTHLYSASDFAGAYNGYDYNVMGYSSYSIGNTAFGANAGYDFALNNHWLLGPELGYYDLGYSRYKGEETGVFSNNTLIRSSTADLLARLTYVFGTGFNAFGKLGGAYVFQKAGSVVGLGSTPASPSRSVSKLLPEADLGFGYQFTNGLGLGASYQYIFGSSESDSHFLSSADRANNAYSTAAIYGEVSYRFGA